ncbi:TPA: fimbria/pilus outer membrane usher protein [Photobacterium damselae]|nr:fimbria/pilus outer membrane usher protein [Photobacterium damselae]
MPFKSLYSVFLFIYYIIIYNNIAYAVEFNTDIFDLGESSKDDIDISRFSQKGYILPGNYSLKVLVNGEVISANADDIDFIEINNRKVKACLTDNIIKRIGFTTKALNKVTKWNHNVCNDLSKIDGIEIIPDIGDATLKLSIPQIWLEYIDSSWLPPSRWENGINGLMIDYNINSNLNKYSGRSSWTKSISYNGTIGANVSSWRLRLDYQGNAGDSDFGSTSFDISRSYLYTSIPELRSKLTVGEHSMSSDIFSPWQYTGIGLESDDRMLPPKLRGYAPQVKGVADTNARVIIKSKNRVVYDAIVPAGPFAIKDLDSSLRGRLDVEVIEEDGRKKEFSLETSTIPYLTRPGQIKYKMAVGRPRRDNHNVDGPLFIAGETSVGITNNWSLYGGAVLAKDDYSSFAIGVGRDLGVFGTLSADISQSIARIDDKESTKKGKSWRFNYSKSFDDADADIQFAGYKFSEEDYMTMDQFLDARKDSEYRDKEKELFTISLDKNFSNIDSSISLQLNHQTYWDKDSSDDYYTFSLYKYFDAFDLKDISLSFSATRSVYSDNNEYQDDYEDSYFLRVSVPLGYANYLNLGSSMSADRYTNTVGYSASLNHDLDHYSITAGVNSGDGRGTDAMASAYYSKTTPYNDITANVSYNSNEYTNLGLSIAGGVTVTANGGAFHSGGTNGDTRLMVDTDGIGDVPIAYGQAVTNDWGIGVVTSINSYARNTTAVDFNKLPDDIETTDNSVIETVLTEGAIGYKKLTVVKGLKLFATITRGNGQKINFGENVVNKKGQELGISSDNGLVWLTGVNSGEILTVSKGSKAECNISIPDNINEEKILNLVCS